MTFRGPFRGAPGRGGLGRRGKSDCRLCRGDRWVRKTPLELNEDEEFERLMDFVFGPPMRQEIHGFGSSGRPTLPPKCKWCPECLYGIGLEDNGKELEALRILAKRTERGTKFFGDRANESDWNPSDYLDSPLSKPKPKPKPKPKKRIGSLKGKTQSGSIVEQLEMLARLYNDGALTEQEFKTLKSRLIKGE